MYYRKITKLIEKYFPIVFPYLISLLGLVSISWIIWSRFIRERTIRDIPDSLFSEYRFWILFYICFVYLYAIKNLIKPKEANIILVTISEFFYKPLVYLDKYIKYTVMGKKKYFIISRSIINFLDKRNKYETTFMVVCFTIIPRLFLVLFLLVDTFYFCKLDLFYKVILLGLLPLFFRYFKYSVKDIYNFWVEELEQQYATVLVFREGFAYIDFNADYDSEDDDECFERMDNFYNMITAENNDAIYHYKEITIKEYIELQFTHQREYLINDLKYQYIGKPRAHKLIAQKRYEFRHRLISEIIDDDSIHELFHELFPDLLRLKFYLTFSPVFSNKDTIIKVIKIVIFFLYFTCWSFTLSVCCYCYPVELLMFKYYIINLIHYLVMMDDPFIGDHNYVLKEHLLTIRI